MGLFGFFATLFGVGAMTKDYVGRKISAEEAKHNAEINNKPYYFTGNGSEIRSTITGRRVSHSIDTNTRHDWLVDTKTGERIEDLTLRKNKEKTEQNRREAHSQGKRFYRTAMFDVPPNGKPSIYVCDDFPGQYFERHSLTNNEINEIFRIREVEPDRFKKGHYTLKHVNWNKLPNWFYTHNLDKVTISGNPYKEEE